MRDFTHPGVVGRPPQPWAKAAAWIAFLCVLPSILWRVAMVSGVDTGFADAEFYYGTFGNTAYVLILDAVQLLGGLLCLGLAYRWGEQIPDVVPGLGGRIVHRLVPAILGWLAFVVLVAGMLMLGIQFGAAWISGEGWTPDAGMNSPERTMLAACYLPLLAWPPALAVALVGYWKRRSRSASD